MSNGCGKFSKHPNFSSFNAVEMDLTDFKWYNMGTHWNGWVLMDFIQQMRLECSTVNYLFANGRGGFIGRENLWGFIGIVGWTSMKTIRCAQKGTIHMGLDDMDHLPSDRKTSPGSYIIHSEFPAVQLSSTITGETPKTRKVEKNWGIHSPPFLQGTTPGP